jgi:nitroreductase/NAD-dependent dihydropyrimidine dehydrogenase PreA subunit
MNGLTVDHNKCQRDGICAADCPAGIIKMKSSENYPEPVAGFGKFCLACGHCVAICPHEALSLDWLSPEACPPIKTNLNLTTEQAEQFLRARRSVRNFIGKVVDPAMLNQLIEIGTYAPSAKNEQPWYWLVIQNPAETRRLAGLVVDWMRVFLKEQPELAKQKMHHRVVAAWEKGKDSVCREAPHIIIVHADKNYSFGAENCTNALSYIELFAPVIGLGTCWAGYFQTAANSYAPLYEELGAPAGHHIFGALMVGYPKFKYHRLPVRKSARITWK